MKKLFLAISLNFIFVVSFGQQNPIQNLSSSFQYIMPLNCFTLSWSMPVPSSTDTLMGYNVYRNDSLYTFTTNQSIGHNPCFGDTSSMYFSFMVYQSTFWAHVTAVYNSAHIESAYNDSSFWMGALATGLEGKSRVNEMQISPNPFSSLTTLNFVNQCRDASLRIFNASGQMIKQINNISGQKATLNRENLKSGFYIIQLIQEDSLRSSEKLIVTDN